MKEGHMRSIGHVLVISVLVLIGLATSDHSGAQPPKTKPAKVDPSKARIVPVVMLKRGETKEILPSTRWTVGMTRSDGLHVRETEGKAARAKVWKRDGVVVEV